MSLANKAVEIFLSQLGSGNLDTAQVQNAFKNLLPTGASGDLDLTKLVGMLSNGNLGALVSSWLGDGANDAVSPSQLASVLGENKISEFAKQLGLPINQVSEGLASALPQLIDQSSKGGNLLESVIAGGGLESIAKNVLGSLFK
jgi:uncharacterized protein YidB (DUF937 family)